MNLYWPLYALGGLWLAFLALDGSRYSATQPVLYRPGMVVEFSYWAERPVDRARREGGR